MNRTPVLSLVLFLALSSAGLGAPAAVAGTAPPSVAALGATPSEGDVIPSEVFTAAALETLDRLVFRYEPVHFDFDSSVLRPAGKLALLRKVRWLMAHPEASVIVEGHCDPRGSLDYNRELGARRAEAACAYLIQQGVSPDRIRRVSWGEEQPDATGDGETAWSRNRRAEVIPR